MSRYYDIQIFYPNSTKLFRQYTSYPKVGSSNQNDPGALNVLLDAYVYTADAAEQQAVVKIWGVAIQDIMQANNYTGCSVKIYAGFQKGFPLNNPSQAGLILSGSIFQSFANWQGTEMTLDFVITITGALAAQKSNVSFNWVAGQPLSTAIAAMLTSAFPGVAQTINISPKLVLAYDVPGVYPSLTAFGQMLKPLTQSILGGSYPGVTITTTATGIVVQDGGAVPSTQPAIPTFTFKGVSYPVVNGTITVPADVGQDPDLHFSSSPGVDAGITKLPNGDFQVSGVTPNNTPPPPTTVTTPPKAPAVQIAFQDLIGQPTWIANGIIQFVCPMRADLSVGALITMPKGILGNPANPAGAPGAVVTTSASQPQARQASLFSGNFLISLVHYMGEFRNPDGQAWVTVFNATTQPASPS